MNPEQQLRERMREAAAAIRPAGDPLAAIEHRATSIRRRRATVTAGALVIAVMAASLVTSTRSAGGESPPATPVATEESTAAQPRTTVSATPRTDSLRDDPSSGYLRGAGGHPWAAGFPARTTTRFLASDPKTLSWAADRSNATTRTTDVGVLVPGDSIWLLYSPTATAPDRPAAPDRPPAPPWLSVVPEYLTPGSRMRILDFE